MTSSSEQPCRILKPPQADINWPLTFSVCVVVRDWQTYKKTRQHFSAAGFSDANSEFLAVDNSEKNTVDAFQAIRMFLSTARGRFVIVAHQDAYPLQPCEILIDRLRLLEQHDPMWGVAGDAGVTRECWPRQIGSLQMPSVSISMSEPFKRVIVLDENVLIMRNGSGVTVSADLEGYHFYGLDACSVAARLGFNSYVLDYLWRHDSEGTIGTDFLSSKHKLEAKLRAYCSSESLPTACTYVCWSQHLWERALSSSRSFLQVFPQRRLGEARRLLWKEGLRNPLFLPALCVAAIGFASKLAVVKLQHMSRTTEKCKAAIPADAPYTR